MKRFLPALMLVVLVVSTAPFMGQVRDVLFDSFGASAVRGIALVLLGLAACAFSYAIFRIRHHRLLRYGALALAAGLLWLQEIVLGAGIEDAGLASRVSVAERIHIVEYGLLAYLLYRAFKPAGDLSMLLLPLLWVTVAGVADESMQWLVETRLGEIRDVFLNVYAGLCGLLFSLALDPPVRSPERGPAARSAKGRQMKHFAWRLAPGQRRLTTDAAGLAVLVMGLFFSFAHLGYQHFDPEIGRFLSWHSPEELRQAAADRAIRWRDDPPTELSPWRREDYFLTEAAWHVNHRNERFRAGDRYLAAQANRILEKYYSPFLDLKSFRGSGKHRYPPVVRDELEAKAPRRDPERYSSGVLEHRIYTWPSKTLFFAVLIPAVLVIWLLPRILSPKSAST